jgi:hypothetical protein
MARGSPGSSGFPLEWETGETRSKATDVEKSLSFGNAPRVGIKKKKKS